MAGKAANLSRYDHVRSVAGKGLETITFAILKFPAPSTVNWTIGASVRPKGLTKNDGRGTRAIQGYLGHKSIGNTVKYTELARNRFAGFSD
jgi:hypothetical protein